MNTLSLTRAAFVAGIVGLGMIAAAPAYAARNADAERYVQENAAEALRTLGDRSVPATQRRQTFNLLMTRFADVPRVAGFVLGRYGAQLRSDAALRTEWVAAFQEYSIAVYETQLDRYSGGTIRVTDSVERVPGRDVIVTSEIVPRGANRPLPVQWRMLRSGDTWKVVDVSLLIEGNQIWLAQQQQAEFIAFLGRNNGDIRALIGNVRGLTASMRQRVVARG
ncbi:MAG: ABC transporter substrate-binding protein [Hyphomonadaceae bacterium]|nr:ABC transporter substrate-binding protein [Hyphomonadaceae bacterium]